MRKLPLLFMLPVLALACIGYAVRAIERGLDLLLSFYPAEKRSAAAPARRATMFSRPALAYDGPPVHQLRHEAGTSKRAADRHT